MADDDIRPTGAIRFGVMNTGRSFRSWQADCLRELLSVEGTRFSLLIVEEPHRPDGASLFSLYSRRFQAVTDRAVDTDSVQGVPALSHGAETAYSEEDLAAIRPYGLDFILRFAPGPVRGGILALPPLGVWSFRLGDERYRGGPAGFWECYEGDPVTGAVLERLCDDPDGGVVLKQGHFETRRSSYATTLETVHSRAARWPAQVVRELQDGAAGYLEAPPSPVGAPVRRAPTGRETATLLWRQGLNRVRDLARISLWRGQWNVGVIDAPIQALLDEDTPPEIRWSPLAEADPYFLADPFGAVRGDDLWILCEECGASTARAMGVKALSAVRVRDGSFSPAQRIAGDAFLHMSYPYLLDHGGETYLVPESVRSKRISLFRALAFPTDWEEVATIADGVRAVDSTIVRFDDRWWLMYTDENLGKNDNLCLLYADDIHGPWLPHKANPVKQDVRSSRPAGTPFLHEGALYRPAQNCSQSYGGSIVLNRVVEMTPSRFSEEPITEIRPAPPYSAGTHTLSSAGEMTVIDGLRFVPRLSLRRAC